MQSEHRARRKGGRGFCFRGNCGCRKYIIIRRSPAYVPPNITSHHSSHNPSSAILPTTPIKKSPAALVRNPTLPPSFEPTYPPTAAWNRFALSRGTRSHASLPERWSMSICIAEPVIPRNCVSALLRVVRQVRMSVKEVFGGSERLRSVSR